MANDVLTLESIAELRQVANRGYGLPHLSISHFNALLDLAERALRDQQRTLRGSGQCRAAWCTRHVRNGFVYCADCASSPQQVPPSMDPDPVPHVLGGES